MPLVILTNKFHEQHVTDEQPFPEEFICETNGSWIINTLNGYGTHKINRIFCPMMID